MSTVGGGEASYGDIEKFYGQWKANLSSDVKEQAAFAALNDDDKTIVLLAFKLLSKEKAAEGWMPFGPEARTIAHDTDSTFSHESGSSDGSSSSTYSIESGSTDDSNVDFGSSASSLSSIESDIGSRSRPLVTKQELDGVLEHLQKNKRLSFKADKQMPEGTTRTVDQSYKNIMRVAEHLSTEIEKGGVLRAETKFRSIYAERAALKVAFKDDFVGQMMEGTTVPKEGLFSSKPLYDNLEAWAKKEIQKGSFQDAALKIVKDLREQETEFTRGKIQESNLRNQVKVFQDRLAFAFVELNPQLTSEDIKDLNRTEVKGTSQQQVIRDSFIDLGKVFIWPLQKAFGVAVDAKGTVKSVREGFIKLMNPNRGRRLIATFQEIFTQIKTAPLESMGVVGRGPFESMHRQNAVLQEINKLEAKIIEEKAGIEKAINDGLAQSGYISESAKEPLLERIAIYHENCQLLLAMMELKESLSVKGYVLLPHLAAGHGKEIHAQANFLMNHVAFAIDMRGVLENTEQVEARMAERGISAQNAYLSLVEGTPPKAGETIPLSAERREVEAEAAEKLERAGNWLQYARSRGDMSAPLYLADLICTSDRRAWSPENADRTFATAHLLLNESFKAASPFEKLFGRDYERRADAMTAMRSLCQLRFEASVRNDPIKEQSHNAHELIKWMKHVNSTAKFPTTAARETALRNQLLGLVLLGSQEAAQVILDQIDRHAEKGRVTAGDVLLLSELAAEGMPGAKDRMQDVESMKPFLNQVEKDAKKGELTSEAFRAIAGLAAHGNEGAIAVLNRLQVLAAFKKTLTAAKAAVDEDKKNAGDDEAKLEYWESRQTELQKTVLFDQELLGYLKSKGVGLQVQDMYSFTSQTALDKFYDRYVLSPAQIDLNIPSYQGPTIKYGEIAGRANRGEITEQDVANLVLAIGNGNRHAILVLDEAIVKMAAKHRDIQNATNSDEVLKFAKWALAEAKSARGLQPPPADQADNIKERYDKLFPAASTPAVPWPTVASFDAEFEKYNEDQLDLLETRNLVHAALIGNPNAPSKVIEKVRVKFANGVVSAADLQRLDLLRYTSPTFQKDIEKLINEISSEKTSPNEYKAFALLNEEEKGNAVKNLLIITEQTPAQAAASPPSPPSQSEVFFTEMGRRFESGVVTSGDLEFLKKSLLSSENKVKAGNLLRIIANAKTQGIDDHIAFAKLEEKDRNSNVTLLAEIMNSLKPPAVSALPVSPQATSIPNDESVDEYLLDEALNDFEKMPQAPAETRTLLQTMDEVLERLNEGEERTPVPVAESVPAAAEPPLPSQVLVDKLFEKMNEGGEAESQAFFTEIRSHLEGGVVSFRDVTLLTSGLLKGENKNQAQRLLETIINTQVEGSNDYTATANLAKKEKFNATMLLNEALTLPPPTEEPLVENSLLTDTPKVNTFKDKGLFDRFMSTFRLNKKVDLGKQVKDFVSERLGTNGTSISGMQALSKGAFPEKTEENVDRDKEIVLQLNFSGKASPVVCDKRKLGGILGQVDAWITEMKNNTTSTSDKEKIERLATDAFAEALRELFVEGWVERFPGLPLSVVTKYLVENRAQLLSKRLKPNEKKVE